jgi:hypothetical protein
MKFICPNDKNFMKNRNHDKEVSSKTFNTSTHITANISSNFNFVIIWDWDCTGETEDTVEYIIEQDPGLVLALGDLSYNGDARCWLELIEPIAERTKIARYLIQVG